MFNVKLKPCPFCGAKIQIEEEKENIICRQVTASCLGCRATFEHQQDFAYSKIARVALNDSFENWWNERVGGHDV